MMKLTPAMEDYLETIFILSKQDDGVRVSDIAHYVSVTKASTNRAVATLTKFGLVEKKPYKEVYLTDKGYEYANAIVRKHRVIKQFFTDILNIDEEIADKEACLIEHVISTDTIRAMQMYANRNSRKDTNG